MAGKNIAARRKLRELEAKRDRHLEAKSKAITELAKVRAELREHRRK